MVNTNKYNPHKQELFEILKFVSVKESWDPTVSELLPQLFEIVLLLLALRKLLQFLALWWQGSLAPTRASRYYQIHTKLVTSWGLSLLKFRAFPVHTLPTSPKYKSPIYEAQTPLSWINSTV